MTVLSTSAMAVYEVLIATPGGVTAEANALLAQRTGISQWEAARAVSELERVGLIDVRRTKRHRVHNPTGRILIVRRGGDFS